MTDWLLGEIEPPEGTAVRLARDDDPDHETVRRLYGEPTRRYLWVPEDAIDFTPPVSEVVYGDGGAVYSVTTCYNRPASWVFRGDTRWSEDDLSLIVETVLVNLSREFGDGEPPDPDYDPEEAADYPDGRPYPAVDMRDGYSFCRLDEFSPLVLLPHPETP